MQKLVAPPVPRKHMSPRRGEDVWVWLSLLWFPIRYSMPCTEYVHLLDILADVPPFPKGSSGLFS